MNILVLNLPGEKLMRRYNCTYRPFGFLYPPQELLRVATIIKEHSGHRVYFIDAVAEKMKLREVIEFTIDKGVELVITLLGLEYIERDYEAIKELKRRKNGIKVIGFGFTISRHKEKFKDIDLVLDKAFETRIFKALENTNTSFIESLQSLQVIKVKHQSDAIRQVERRFIRAERYNDIFVKGKTAWLFYAFGCPFRCNYCVKTYDLDVLLKRNIGNVFKELRQLAEEGYKNIRFLDDNITIDEDFLRRLDEFLKKERLKFNFYGFSRIDLLDEAKIVLLKSMNFRRLYIGIETLNPKMQSYYDKNINVDLGYLRQIFGMLKKNGIEVAVWIMFHPLFDNPDDLALTAKSLSRMKVELALINILIPYADTGLIEKESTSLSFKEGFLSGKFNKKIDQARIHRVFWANFLSNPDSIFRILRLFFAFPLTSLSIVRDIIFSKESSENL